MDAPRTTEQVAAWKDLAPEYRERCLVAWAKALEMRLAEVDPSYVRMIFNLPEVKG